MFYVYLLEGKKDNNLYIGFTNNIQQRIKQHNNGSVPSTKSRRPLELVYFEGYKSEKDARHREQNLKLRSRAFAQLKKRITDSLSK
jgi:putative endonuclease